MKAPLLNAMASILLCQLFTACGLIKSSNHQRNRSANNSVNHHDADSDGERASRPDHDADRRQSTAKTGPETLIWKRYRAFEDTLARGLALTKEQVCQELGQSSCIDKIHLTVLGGNEPYVNAQYERAAAPSVLTTVAIERIALAACDERLKLDKQAGNAAVVFKHWPLTAPKITREQVESQVRDLYRRLLARDPEVNELRASREILDMNLSAEKTALGLCFAIASQAENVFL